MNQRVRQLVLTEASECACRAGRARLAAAVRSIPEPNRRWLLVNAVGVTAVINVAVTAGIAWLSTRGLRTIPLVGLTPWRPSTIGDTVGTTFVLPFVTTVICTLAVRRDAHRGHLRPLPPGSVIRELAGNGRHALLPRALLIAARTGLTAGPLAAAGLYLAHFGGVPASAFIVFKIAFAVALGAIVTPCIALAAMAEAIARSQPPGRVT
jgi:hypothetical protein